MVKTIFLNAAKLNFDGNLDFSPISQLTIVETYNESSKEEILERIENQNIVITKELSLERDLLLGFPPSVKLICEAGTGYNNIDIVAAREKNIMVCNIPSYSTEAVAQLVITYILNFSSSLVKQQVMLRQKNFDNFTQCLQVPHFELQNKTLGVIGGTGAIGREVIKIALALGMKIIIYNRTQKNWNDSNVQFLSLTELLQQSDFISLHCPLNAETHHLIDREKLKMMKPTAFLINTARGGIIKERDLIGALQRGEIAGAALDVQDIEPPALDNPLYTMDNVILTPHIGWKRLESRQRLIELMAGNIESFIQGRPIHVVN